MNNKGFTLIEITIVMTIVIIISTMTYMSYNQSQKRLYIKQATREISQSLYEARNLAINGLDTGSGNLSVGLYLSSEVGQNGKLVFYSYPYTYTGAQIKPSVVDDIIKIKEYSLPKGITIDSVSGKNNGLFFFSAIHGIGGYYYWEGGKNDIPLGLDKVVNINISYKNSSLINLQKQIKYYTVNNIVDY